MNSNEQLQAALKKRLAGEVRSDLMTQQIYSVDASIFEVAPLLAALPKTHEDLLTLVECARAHNIPLIPRGGGTGIAGGCLGEGIVVDTSKYLNQILDYNPQERYALCEPGVIQDQLNHLAAHDNLRLGADTSTGNRATLGGMCATNAAGAHSLKYGNMIDHVLGIEMILSNGETVWLEEGSDWPGLPIPLSPPLFHRSSSGYPLYTLLEIPRNLAKLTIGSEGTLGIFSKIKLKLSPAIQTPSIALIPYAELETCLEAVPYFLSYKPISLEVLDRHIVEMGRLSPLLKGKLNWLKSESNALLLAEFEADTPPFMTPEQINLTDPQTQEEVWTLRKAGLGLLLSRRSYTRAIAFIEDLAVPPAELAVFMRELKRLIPWEMGVYGHAGEGCLHTRPYVCVTNPKEMDAIFQIMPAVAQLVKEHGGVLTGEHGDGLIRSWLNPSFYGKQSYAEMLQVKKAFDPLGLMNPGKIVEGVFPREKVRKSRPIQVPTFLNFEKEGGLHLAADLCNGNGACRKMTGLMCPSFHAYKDERHTTRARAQGLRSILNGNIPLEELTGKGLLDVLDYCLQCKGCKKECPSQVDMAKMKMEVLYQHQEKEGYFLKNRLFGNYHTLASLASRIPSLSNGILRHGLMNKALSLIGITPHRPFPKFASERFTHWWKRRSIKKGKQKIHLFIDTFTEFHSPEVGKAAVLLLEKFGFQVEPTLPICCGRTFLSAGLLKQAKQQAERLTSHLETLEEPLIVLEPSCLSALKDDYPSLIGKAPTAFLLEEVLPHFQVETPVLYHPHCHEQVLFNPSPLKRFFPNLAFSESGCCGLAGSFGYESTHFEMSLAIAEKDLFPKIRSTDPLPLVVSGFSCREQIAFGLHKKALHPAQLLLKHSLF